MAAAENRFATELNEKEVIELLEDLSNILEARGIIVNCSLLVIYRFSQA